MDPQTQPSSTSIATAGAPPARVGILAALAAARAAMPVLEKNDVGFDAEDNAFMFPRETDLRDAVALVFADNNLMEVIGDALAAAGFIDTTWTLHHLTSGETLTHRIQWPIDNNQRLSRPHAAAAAWSHAWRHFMIKLLAVKTVAKKPPTPADKSSADLDQSVGEMPTWSEPPPPVPPSIPPVTVDAPWRAQQRLHEERAARPVDTSREAPWSAAGAVIESPAQSVRELFVVWADVCADIRKAGCSRRWDSVLLAWHEFSGRSGDVLAPEDPAFKAWLATEAAAHIRKHGRAA